MNRTWRGTPILASVGLLFGFVFPLPLAAADRVDFVRDIQPLLAAHCTQCHGGGEQEGGLRLDSKSRAMTGGDSGKVIVPGDPEKSELIARVIDDDESTRMPPEEDPLSAEQIRLLRRWIQEGATWPDGSDAAQAAPDHWSFKPIERPDLPDRLEANCVDKFVRARLAGLGIEPSPAADRHTLIRRLSLDLTGLPPKVDEIQAFVDDSSPDAYERLVDRLLAAPHFGERWAMHWLDMARYADSDGYEKDTPRPNAYRWRDWVIEAINRDLPFDQFTVQQLAGDLLPGATDEVKLATGFHRNTLTNREGGVDQEEFRVKAAIDRINTTCSVWMGLTAGCAECHSHKYDPLTQREFYSLYAFFNEANEQDIQVDPPPDQRAVFESRLAEHHQKLAELTARLDAEKPRLREQLKAWEQALKKRSDERWSPVEVTSSGSEDSAAGKSVYRIVAKTDLARVTGIRLQVNPNSGQVTEAATAGFALSHVEISAQPSGKGNAGRLLLGAAVADGAKGRQDIGRVLDADDPNGWSVGEQIEQPASALFATANEAGRAGRIGNDLAGGSQDGATNLLNVYYQSPISAMGTVDKIRTFTQAAAGLKVTVYLLRPAEGAHRVVYGQEFTADGSSGEKEYVLSPPWQVRRGDLFAHSGNGGPTFKVDSGTDDIIYFPLKDLPKQGSELSLGRLPKIPSRSYALQVNFAPAAVADTFVKPAWDERGAILTLRLALTKGSPSEIQVAVTDQPDPLDQNAAELPDKIAAIVNLAPAERNDEQKAALLDHFVSLDEVGKNLSKQISDHKKKTPKRPTAVAHVMAQGGPRATHVHQRGNFREKGDQVQPATPAFLPELKPRGPRPDRLDLARWIVSGDNPLSARVAVNHVWAVLFGRGLVRTTEDFGSQGEPPSHPELLDWLSSEFTQLGFSRKRLVKLIVLSETYRQQSRTRQDLVDRDPENLLLARQNRFRLEAELVRDQYLAAGGLLNRQVGGPSFRPPLPESVVRVQFVNKWKADAGPALYRRGMYIHLQRNLMLPLLMTFDRPEAILTCARRVRSNTPLQALALLNAPIFVEAARAIAMNLAGDGSLSDDERVRQAFLRTVSREPTEYERQRVRQLLDELSGYYTEHADAATQLAGEGLPDSVSPPLAAAWVAVCRTVLNLDEVITRE